MKKKFTPEELQAAMQQITEERIEANSNAEKAAEWLKTQLNMPNCKCYVKAYFGTAFEDCSEPNIILVHETYGPYLEDYINVLNSALCVTKEAIFYYVDSPYGRFRITFEYFDNHCTGY